MQLKSSVFSSICVIFIQKFCIESCVYMMNISLLPLIKSTSYFRNERKSKVEHFPKNHFTQIQLIEVRKWWNTFWIKLFARIIFWGIRVERWMFYRFWLSFNEKHRCVTSSARNMTCTVRANKATTLTRCVNRLYGENPISILCAYGYSDDWFRFNLHWSVLTSSTSS